MLLIHCPYCERELPELEFRQSGEAHIARPADWNAVSNEDFETFFFIRDNAKGVVFERWRHVHGCGRFFNAARHSVSDKFIRTYKAGEAKPELSAEEMAAATPKGRGTPANEPVIEGPKGDAA